MHEDEIKKSGITPLMKLIHQVADNFPVDESAIARRTLLKASKDSEDMANTILYLAKLGVPALISSGVGADGEDIFIRSINSSKLTLDHLDKDPDVVVVQASPPWRIGLPAKDYYENAEVVEEYKQTIRQVFEALQPDENSTIHAQWIKATDHGNIASSRRIGGYAYEVVEFEKKLAMASPNAEDQEDVTVSLRPF